MPETFIVLNADNRPVSTGTVVADPLPDGFTARPLNDAEVTAMQAGSVWDGETFPPVYVPPFPALDPAGAGPLATLLVVEGVLPLEDAAHSVGTTGDHLVHEAISWSVG
jgi:hypothetical protein